LLLSIVKNSFARYLAAVLGFAVVPIMTRSVGPEVRGEYVYIVSLATMLSSILTLSIHNVIHEKGFQEIKQKVFFSFFCLLLLVLIITFLFIYSLGISPFWLLINLFSISILVEWAVLQYLLSKGNQEKCNSLILGASFLNFFCVLAASYFLPNLVMMICAFFISRAFYFFTFLDCFLKYKTELFYIFSKPAKFFYVISRSKYIYAGSVGLILIGQLDIILLGLVKGNNVEIANYQLALQLLSLFYILAQSVSAYVYADIKTLGEKNGFNNIKKLLLNLPLFMLFTAMICYFLLPYIIPIFGVGFDATRVYFLIVMFSVPIMSIKYIMEPLIFYHGLGKLNSISVVTSGIVVVIINAIFIPHFGATASAYAIVLSSLMQGGVLLILYKRIKNRIADV
tara:strand:+ start:4321 stop:5511 length:1191 start_codon:yes stop_codon:yes gene_type:complete